MAKHKYIETPEKMWELFEGYKESLKPRAIEKATPRGVITEMHTPPLTYEGFKEYGFQNGLTVDHYFRNTNDAYNEYCGICSRIKNAIRRDQIEGGMVGQYNPSITQRLNGLTEKTDVTTNGDNIGGKIEVEIVTKRNEDTSD
jgi:hypothetical protein